MIRMLNEVGETDRFFPRVCQEVKAGYLAFCRNHPGFDDEALQRAAERARESQQRTEEDAG